MLEWCISETRPIFIIKIVNKWRNICHFSTYITSVGSAHSSSTFPFIRRSLRFSSSTSLTFGSVWYVRCSMCVLVFCRRHRRRCCCCWCCEIDVTCFTFIPDPHPQSDTHFSFSFRLRSDGWFFFCVCPVLHLFFKNIKICVFDFEPNS